jgi:threonine dehydrogenase-like Zn-dependent dehydrogenase
LSKACDGSRHAVVIVGGGTAGCAIVIAPARGVEDVVVVVNARARLAHRRSRSARLPRCAPNRLGVWDDFLAQGHLPSAKAARAGARKPRLQ